MFVKPLHLVTGIMVDLVSPIHISDGVGAVVGLVLVSINPIDLDLWKASNPLICGTLLRSYVPKPTSLPSSFCKSYAAPEKIKKGFYSLTITCIIIKNM